MAALCTSSVSYSLLSPDATCAQSPIATSMLHNSELNNMDPSSTIPKNTEPRDSNTTPSLRKNRHSSIPQILIHPPPESKRHTYIPFFDLSPTLEESYSPRRRRHEYHDPHCLNTFQIKYIPPHTCTRRSPIILNEWYKRSISCLETKIADVAKGLYKVEVKDEERERAKRVRWLMDRRDEMRRQSRELEVEEWEEREEREKKEKERQEKGMARFSGPREGEKRIAGGANRREGRDYELTRKRLVEMFSNSRRIIA